MYCKGFKFEIVSADLFGGYANSYILETKNNIFIIDANIESAKNTFDLTLKDFSINTKPIKLLISHGHWDHVALAYHLKQKYNATIYANINSIDMMSNKQYQLDNLYDKYAPKYSFKDGILNVWQKDFINTIKPDLYLNDNDEFIDEGFSLKVINTPGHSDDELSFYNKENNIIFTADTLQARGYNLHPALYDNPNKLLSSIDIIKQLNPSCIYGGHFYLTEPDTCKRYIEESIIFIKENEKFIIDNKNLSFDELIAKYLKEYGYEYSIHVIMSLKSHLD